MADSLLLAWRQSRPAVDRYWFEISTDSLMTNPVVDSMLTDTTTVRRELISNQTYWWRVRAYNAAGWGPFSEKRRFSIVVTSVQATEELPKEFSLSQNYPNPFNLTTNIRFSIPKRSTVTLKLFNILGREVATLVDEDLSPGEYKVVFDPKGLSSGVYFYQIQAGEFVQIKKLVLLR